ncbi:MAG: glycosyltransferase [Microcystaceae cyanobacterium]
MTQSNQTQVAFYMRVLSGGGAEKVIVTLMRQLVKQGIKVDLILNVKEGPYLPQVPDAVRIIELGTPKLKAGLPKFIQYLRQERPCCLFPLLPLNTEVGIVAKILSGVPIRLIVSQRNLLSARRRSISKGIERWIPLMSVFSYRFADKITAVSHGVADDLVKVTGISRSKIKVIYNPIDHDYLHQKAQDQVDHPWFQPNQPPVILGIGRLEPQKDFQTLIRAFELVRQQHSCRLVLLGRGSERQSLTHLIEELGLKEEIALLGFVENPYAYLKRSNVFVLSSIWEGMPNVLLEALALGVPSISTDCQGKGAAEVLDNGRCGPLVPIGDPKAIADEILKVLSGDVKSCDPQWLEQFSIDKICQQYQDVMGIGGR